MDDANGFELWAYPVGGSSHMVKDISAGTPSSHPGNLTSFNGKVFFTATTPETGFELWTSDGTPNGTRLLKDINRVPDQHSELQVSSGVTTLMRCSWIITALLNTTENSIS